MNPNKQATKAGLTGFDEITELTGVSRQTLSNWSKNKPELLKIVILGCVAARLELSKDKV